MGDIAADELQKSGGANVDWNVVEDRMIAASLSLDQSPSDVAETLCLYSPGAVTKDEQAKVADRVDRLDASLQNCTKIESREP